MLLSSTAEAVFLKDKNLGVLKLSDTETAVVKQGIFDKSAQEIVGILGVIQLKVGRYLITIKSTQQVGEILNKPVYKVLDSGIIPLNSYPAYDADEHKYLDLLRFQLDLSTFYFSEYDLTNSVQRNFAGAKRDTRFHWNHFLGSSVHGFATPVIQGYVKFHKETVKGTDIAFGLITRRSRFRAGTRYFRRGVDSQGHVANYNETEQIMIRGNSVYSYLQTRGSVPVYWAEINNLRYKPELKVSQESSLEAAGKHFDEEVELHGDNYLVNLVNQKGYELPVKRAYEKTVEELANPHLKYIYFDFHHECRNMQWHKVWDLVDKLQTLGMGDKDYFVGQVDLGELKTVKTQHHVVRTNCMDCLDRTNVVQSTLGRFFLQKQLEEAKILEKDEKWDSNKALNFEFMNFWADNADAVSSVYSGTGALKTDFTRTGQRTKAGAFNDFTNSATRYLKNNYKDGDRQDSFDLILGEYIPTAESPFVDSRPYALRLALNIYLTFLFLLVAVFLKVLVYGLHPKQKFFILICFVGLLSTGLFMLLQGLQIVNWPKLVALPYLKTEPVYSDKTYIGHKYVKNSDF